MYSFFSIINDMKPTKSPCIDRCKFTGKHGWCIGCGRTLQECREYKNMKPYARIRLNKDLDRRMIFLSNDLLKNL